MQKRHENYIEATIAAVGGLTLKEAGKTVGVSGTRARQMTYHVARALIQSGHYPDDPPCHLTDLKAARKNKDFWINHLEEIELIQPSIFEHKRKEPTDPKATAIALGDIYRNYDTTLLGRADSLIKSTLKESSGKVDVEILLTKCASLYEPPGGADKNAYAMALDYVFIKKIKDAVRTEMLYGQEQ